jgi:hypothetical protein
MATYTWPSATSGAGSAQEQGAQQGGDVQAVGVGVGEDADLAVAQADRSSLPGSSRWRRRCRALPARPAPRRIRPPRCSGSCRAAAGWPGTPVARLLGRAAGGVALDQEQLGARRILRGAVGELAGQGGTWVIFLRTTCFSAFRRAWARSMASWAIFSPSWTCWFSHRLKASVTTPSTKAAHCARTGVPWSGRRTAGRVILTTARRRSASQTSSGASLTPRGSRLRNSQNSRTASVRPVRRPLTWVPPCAVGSG